MIKHVFLNFGNVRAYLEFDDDNAYDDCRGTVVYRLGDELQDMECFYSPKERDTIMARVFSHAAAELNKLHA